MQLVGFSLWLIRPDAGYGLCWELYLNKQLQGFFSISSVPSDNRKPNQELFGQIKLMFGTQLQ